ncbi:hypothetical protein CJJ18_08425 [Candidatus Williamhamiltonella defendens]|uniref:Uncharacterized protein n=1 Tax=Candidatus Williamhamiltonella defendens TaxID=138072 RepID=A0AAC9VGT0_9ENTR|nr:hypothetical protein CJJ18_08425 [Candidatus Hamiltonella defensa]AWK16953.1 hypothetical protein CCS40_08240 [Candidatus Hamiltonella defensa]
MNGMTTARRGDNDPAENQVRFSAGRHNQVTCGMERPARDGHGRVCGACVRIQHRGGGVARV